MAESNGSKEPCGKKLKMSIDKPSPVKQAFLASLNVSSEFTGLKKISELTVDSARCSFHGRVIFIRECLSKTNIPYLCVVFLDGSGEIKAIGWRGMVNYWMSRLKLNEVYTISNFKIDSCDSRFSRVMPGNLQVTLDKFIKIESVKWSRGKSINDFPNLTWKIKSFEDITTADLRECAVVDLIGLLINSSFEKSNEAIDSSDGIVDDGESDMQIVLRNEIEGQTILIGRLAFLMLDMDKKSFKKGKTVIRLKGVKITKQDFPLKGDVFQDSVLEINPCSINIPLSMRDWMDLLNDDNEEIEEKKEENDAGV